MRIPQSISRAKEETSQIQRLARISDVAPPTWSYIGQWQSSFQKGLPFEEVNALQIHHHADKLSARLLVHGLRQVDCSHCIRHALSVTVPYRTVPYRNGSRFSSLKRFRKPRVFGKPRNRTPAVVIQRCVLGSVALYTSCDPLTSGLEQGRVGSATRDANIVLKRRRLCTVERHQPGTTRRCRRQLLTSVVDGGAECCTRRSFVATSILQRLCLGQLSLRRLDRKSLRCMRRQMNGKGANC